MTQPNDRPTPSDRAVLETALRANPDDRTAHAAYADLLTEQNDPRGEFIRVQLALEDEALPKNERKQLQKREKELRDAHEAEWLGALAPYLLGSDDERRAAYANDFTGNEADYFGAEPPDVDYRWVRGWLAVFVLRSHLSLNLARALVRCPAARLLWELHLRDYQSSRYSARYAKDGDWPAGHFTALDVLQRGDTLEALRSFQLGETPDQEEDYHNGRTGADSLVPLVSRMPYLDELLVYGQIGDVDSLFRLPNLTALRRLHLYHSKSYPLQALAQNPALTRLEDVRFFPHAYDGGDEGQNAEDSGAFITLAGVTALVNSPHLRSLRYLQLRASNMGDAGAEAIVKSGILKRLKLLDLRHGRITDEGARTFAACKDVKNLQELDLVNNRLTDAGIAALRESGVNVRAERQQEAPYEDETYLFVGDGE